MPEAHNDLGYVLEFLGQRDEAAACFQQALVLRPDYEAAHNNLGLALAHQGRPVEAEWHFREALRLQPNFPGAANNLGLALAAQDRPTEAIDWYREALRLQPVYAEAVNNWGAVLEKEALCRGGGAGREAIRLDPRLPEAHRNLGVVLARLGRYDEALNFYERALELRPNYPDARLSRALVWLTLGNFEEGWPEYEWRWHTNEFPRRHFDRPRWDGSPQEGRTALLWAEQGMGDTIHFVRYAALVRSRGGRVVVECQAPLVPLLSHCPNIDQVVAQGSPLPPFDTHAPLLTLPVNSGHERWPRSRPMYPTSFPIPTWWRRGGSS